MCRAERGAPPSGGPCRSVNAIREKQHGPPDGGRTLRRHRSINMALLTEGVPTNCVGGIAPEYLFVIHFSKKC
jgi:hypothetical protein